ncbi:DEAD/DEAH box helicase [Halarcobacter ebronensis]|uniref:DEAD/DEAH box helicase n=1 Tax=Halarcobacter ebronensis TaxID=1462615 RepID=UPI00155D88A7|nr:DEAD/DEAH box helicase [Halarcobacter ebronensis]
MLKEDLPKKKLIRLLQIAIIFLNEKDINIINLGYKIILMYSNKTADYKPLFDISINKGFIPISKFIEKNLLYKKESFFNILNSSYMENYKSEKIYLTSEQKKLNEFFMNEIDTSLSIVAPTSYGKSELIIEGIKKQLYNNICIIVPTKALVSQTKKRIIESNIENIPSILTFPEMYTPTSKNILAVLTQERLLRLLKKDSHLKFDLVFVDEAHNLLDNNSRSTLLAITIAILNKRNQKAVFKYLTPFLLDSKNLNISYAKHELKEFRVSEYIKSEKFFIRDFREKSENKNIEIYDQFLNKFFEIKNKSFINEIDLIINEQGSKNIIYFNKPKQIELFSIMLSEKLPIVKSKKIEDACKNLSKFLHKDYNLIKCLKKGIIYHHGSVPNQVRLYIEDLFRKEKCIKFIVTSSTLLEGVNLPINKLFMLDNKKGKGLLTPSQFKNLIGRLSRFSEVFSNNSKNMNLLEPEIYLIGSDFIAENADIKGFIKNCMQVDKKHREVPTNVLLENTNISEKNKKEKKEADEFIANFESDILENKKIEKSKTKIGSTCFSNNIVEIDILQYEEEMNNILIEYQDDNERISSPKEVFNVIVKIFLPFIKEKREYENIRRLHHNETQNFYTMFLEWRMNGTPYNYMVGHFLWYWERFNKKEDDTNISNLELETLDVKKYKVELEDEKCLVYVGKWGDEKRGGFAELWTNIRYKTKRKRVNLAIVRIHEEQEFLDNTLIKFIEVLNELEVLEESLYNLIKYGTEDIELILLIKNGISLYLGNKIVNEYSTFIEINLLEETYSIDKRIVQEMMNNNEDTVTIFELAYILGVEIQGL